MQFAVRVDEVDDWLAVRINGVDEVVDEVVAADVVGWHEVSKTVVVDAEFEDDLVVAVDFEVGEVVDEVADV